MNDQPAQTKTVTIAASPVVYLVDADDRLIRVNEAWNIFANANDGKELCGTMTGKRLWGYITDLSVQKLYRALADRIRKTGRSVEFPFRCDSPEVRRFMRMRIEPEENGTLRYACHTDRIEPQPVSKFFDHFSAQPQAVSLCGVCGRVKVRNEWVDVEDVYSGDTAVAQDRPVWVHSTICKSCADDLEALTTEL